MNRRSFFTKLGAGLVLTISPNIFVPKLIKPNWRIWKNNDQINLIKAIGSRDQNVSREAQKAFACVMGPFIYQILETQTASAFITPTLYGCFESIDESLVIPMDLYYGPHPRSREGERRL